MNRLEEELYAQAARELATKTAVPGVLAKAIADADGDEKKAFARYIALRVQRLKDEIRASDAQRQAESPAPVQDQTLKAWRKTLLGKEDWVIQPVNNGLRFIDSRTRESITVSVTSPSLTIQFRPRALFHKIVLTNKNFSTFSFNAHPSTVEAAQDWWNRRLQHS